MRFRRNFINTFNVFMVTMFALTEFHYFNEQVFKSSLINSLPSPVTGETMPWNCSHFERFLSRKCLFIYIYVCMYTVFILFERPLSSSINHHQYPAAFSPCSLLEFPIFPDNCSSDTRLLYPRIFSPASPQPGSHDPNVTVPLSKEILARTGLYGKWSLLFRRVLAPLTAANTPVN